MLLDFVRGESEQWGHLAGSVGKIPPLSSALLSSRVGAHKRESTLLRGDFGRKEVEREGESGRDILHWRWPLLTAYRRSKLGSMYKQKVPNLEGRRRGGELAAWGREDIRV